MYKTDSLRKYIEESDKVEIIDGIYLRGNKEIINHYKEGKFNNYISSIISAYKELQTINITYPANAKPKLYLYVVPNENFVDLLSYPFKESKGGGRPVPCFEVDGYSTAYGMSENTMTKMDDTEERRENTIHELSHLIFNSFALNKGRMFEEGMAELIPMYILGYEEKINDYSELLKSGVEIQSAYELMNSFSNETYKEGGSCSFRKSYISSYLFLKTIIKEIERNKNLTKEEALMDLMIFLRSDECYNEYLIHRLADYLNLDKNKLLETTEYQEELLKDKTRNKF